MKINEANILILSARNFAPKQTIERHWQERWGENIKSAQFLDCPKLDLSQAELFDIWVHHIKSTLEKTSMPIVIIAHSFAVSACLKAIDGLSIEALEKIKGAFLVAPVIFTFSTEERLEPICTLSQAPYPLNELTFPCFMLASNNDSLSPLALIKDLSKKLGAFFLDAGANGHLDETSGHGPWPEGLLVFSQFMQKL